VSGRKIRVLVVDDSTFVRQALTRMLNADPGIEVVGTAQDGAEGLEKAEKLRPDVVTLDVQMPRMGGLDCLRRLMDENPLPVLLLSSHTREGAQVTLRVREAEEGDAVVAGEVLIAPAGRHLKLRKRGGSVKVTLDEEPRGSLHRPSVDVLMASVARAYGTRALGIVLTGMGSDGVEGLRAIRGAGGRTLAESEETCIIYGMPKAAVEAGVVERSVPLPRVADEILAAV
jgi:chemotaxis response regulator CheB